MAKTGKIRKWRIRPAVISLVLSAALSLGAAHDAFALNVVYDKRTPASHREWADKCYLREQMEVIAAKICKALYGDEPRSKLHENLTMTLYLAPEKGGNPAFAVGRRITWKVGPKPSGSPGMGLLCHEMTHVLDMGSDRVFTEAMADWVRNYKVCTNPQTTLDRRYSALRGGRKYGKYMSGANFVDFMTQNYGEGTIYKILKGYAAHHGKVWDALYGKNLDGLVAEWRQMETIYDPVFQWTYDGTGAGKMRWDGKFCDLRAVSARDDAGKAGAWLDGATAGKVTRGGSGNMTLALHGRFPKKGKVAIASLGAAKSGDGKALLLATTTKADTLAAHVVASVPGKGCQIVSTTPVHVPALAATAHSAILTVKDGDTAVVIIDGKPKARIDMRAKCAGCTFTPAFAVGGMSGGIGAPGFTEPRGRDGVLVDDLRVFDRTFRSRETANYAAAFGPDYRGGVAVEAEWCGRAGAPADDPANWRCFNAAGERVYVPPSKETVVRVWGTNLPSIPPKSKFECKSFTIDGWAVADGANVDLRGVRIVDLADNTRLVSRNGSGFAVNALRANRVRLDGSLAVTAGMKISGNFEMKEGSVLRLPPNADMAVVKSFAIQGDGTVTLRPAEPPRHGRFQKLVRVEEMPADFTRFRLNPGDGPDDAVFQAATGGKFIGVVSRKGR